MARALCLRQPQIRHRFPSHPFCSAVHNQVAQHSVSFTSHVPYLLSAPCPPEVSMALHLSGSLMATDVTSQEDSAHQKAVGGSSTAATAAALK
jgi:hypothetical protein